MALAGGLRTEILSSNQYDFQKSPNDQPTETLQKLGNDLGVAFRDRSDPEVQSEPEVSGDRFSIRGPILYRTSGAAGIDTRWPTPRFIVRDDNDKVHALRPENSNTVLTDRALGDCSILSDTSDGSKPLGDHCNLGSLRKWLTGSLWQRIDTPLYSIELRSGHERNDQGVAKDQALFSRETRRFSDQVVRQHSEWAPSGYAIWSKIDPTLLPPEGTRIRLGGDGHGAILGHADDADVLQRIGDLKQTVLDGVANGKGLLLYLGSPSVFHDGWRPPFNERGHGVTLKAAAVDPPRIIAGWDVGKRQPKPPLRVVPAGATYFYRVTDAVEAAKLV
jgi:hypothetical protein